jgi:hypothetical protein
MERAEVEADQMPGQDSFLDVITNIVGVLILLVLVVGLRSSRAVVTSGTTDSDSIHAAQQDRVQEAYREAVHVEGEVAELMQRTVYHREEAALREQERQWLSEMVTELKQEIDQRRAKLSTNDQRDFDLRRQLTEAQARLDAITREQVALISQGPDLEVIKCEPTPIAKAVTGKEIHVMLSDDHIVILPADELIEQMYDDFAQNSWRLKESDEMVRTIGPMDGFRLEYSFEVRDVVVTTRSGATTSGRKPEFLGLFFLPVTTPIGEPAQMALEIGSEFRQRLANVDATRTTVTLWTYPGNYDRLREVRRVLRSLGFATAIRLPPRDCPIGFSPSGSKSVTE